MLNEIFNKQKYFLAGFAVWILILTAILLANDKIFWQQLINEHHSLIGDYFFKYFTWFGNGLLIALVSIAFVLYRMRLAIFSMATYLISGLLAQILKRFVFDDIHRPAYVFKQLGLEIDQVLDVGLKSHHSFPSGHTTSAFAFFFTLALMLAAKNRNLQILLLLAAIFVGISRLYLNLHFINDVAMGSILGVLTTLLLYLPFLRWKAPWLDQSLIHIIQNRR